MKTVIKLVLIGLYLSVSQLNAKETVLLPDKSEGVSNIALTPVLSEKALLKYMKNLPTEAEITKYKVLGALVTGPIILFSVIAGGIGAFFLGSTPLSVQIVGALGVMGFVGSLGSVIPVNLFGKAAAKKELRQRILANRLS